MTTQMPTDQTLIKCLTGHILKSNIIKNKKAIVDVINKIMKFNNKLKKILLKKV